MPPAASPASKPLRLARSASPSTELPRPPSLPSPRLLGHLHDIEADPLELLMRAWREGGDVVSLRMAHQQVLCVFHPRDIKQILVDDAAHYLKQTRGYHKLRLVIGDGLVTSDGAFWKRQRRIAQPAFHRRCLDGFATTMAQAAEDLAVDLCAPRDLGVEVDVAELMHRLTLRIAGETLFSADISADGDEFGAALGVVLDRFRFLASAPVPYPEWLPTPATVRFWRSLRTMDATVHRLIEERRSSGEAIPDLLGLFMAAKDPETGEGMSPKQLRDEAMTMLTAGHETTANSLAWTFYLLATHPAIGRRVSAEAQAALGAGPAAGGAMEVLSKLPYTHQVVQESMRLFPPVWAIGRRAAKDTVVGGYRVRRGTYVYMTPWVTHRLPAFWPDPEGFDPDRFAPDAVAARKAEGHPRYAWFPFAGGPRQCIGDRFAMMEAVLVLATLCRDFRFELRPGHPVVPDASVTLRPRDGLPMRVFSA